MHGKTMSIMKIFICISVEGFHCPNIMQKELRHLILTTLPCYLPSALRGEPMFEELKQHVYCTYKATTMLDIT